LVEEGVCRLGVLGVSSFKVDDLAMELVFNMVHVVQELLGVDNTLVFLLARGLITHLHLVTIVHISFLLQSFYVPLW
jgi:hypothetical protein